MSKLEEMATSKGISTFELMMDDMELISFRCSSSLISFRDMILNMRKKLVDMSLDEIITMVMQDTGYLEELKKENTAENESRIENRNLHYAERNIMLQSRRVDVKALFHPILVGFTDCK